MGKKNSDVAWQEAPRSLEKHPFYGLILDEKQEAFRNAIWSEDKLIVFCNALAGTGKTLIATATANLLYSYGRYDGIVYIAAPVQEQQQGYLKGTIEEKSEPYFEPFYQALKRIGVNLNTAFCDGSVNEKYQTAYIECVTHTFLRGTNFERKVVIIDEAQNFYTGELMKVLTRIHDSCKVIVIGHDGQNDLPGAEATASGFVPYLKWFGVDERTAVCHLTKNYRGWISSHADAFGKRDDPANTIQNLEDLNNEENLYDYG